MKKYFFAAIPIIMATFFIGCGDSSGDGSDNTTISEHNLQIKSIELQIADLNDDYDELTDNTVYSGHAIEVTYNLYSATDDPGETVVYFYMGDAEYYKSKVIEETDATGYFLGAEHLPLIHEGDNNLTMRLYIPKDVGVGTQRIYAHVDPHNQIEEYDEGDNHYAADAEDISLEIIVNEERKEDIDLHVESFTLTQNNILIEYDNDVDAEADLTTHPYYGNHELEGDLEIHFINTDDNISITTKAQISIDGVWHDMELWDSTSQSYKDSLTHVIDYMTETQLIHLQVNIPDDVYSNIDANVTVSGENEFAIRVVVESSLETNQELADNNELYETVRFYDFNPNKTLTFPTKGIIPNITQVFSKHNGKKKYFKGEFDLESTLAVDAQHMSGTDRLLRSETVADLDFYVFKHHKNFVWGKVYVYAKPEDSRIGYNTKLDILGHRYVHNYHEYNDPEQSYSISVSKTRTLASAKFVVVTIPITIKAKAKGELGAEIDFSWKNGTFAVDTYPYVDFDAIATGGVDEVCVEAGLKIDLLLIGDEFHTKLSTTPTFDDNMTISNISGNFKVYNEIHALDGALSIYADTCVGGGEKELFSFDGFSQKHTIYDKSIDNMLD